MVPNGKLCVSIPNMPTLQFVTPDGRPEGHFKTGLSPLKKPFYPFGLASNKQGEVFVCDTANHVVRVFDHKGNECRRFGDEDGQPGRLHTPYDVAVTPDGKVAVTDIQKHDVQVECCSFCLRGGWLLLLFISRCHLNLLL